MGVIEFLKDWIKGIAIVFILISIIEIAIPNNNMKKTINMVIGLLIIIAIISPFLNLFNKNYDIDTEILKKSTLEFHYENDDDFDLLLKQEEQIKEMYISKIKNDIDNVVVESSDYSVDSVHIEIYEEESKYGNIKSLEILLVEDDKTADYDIEEDIIKVNNVKEIKIGDNHIKEDNSYKLKNEKELKDILYEKYHIPEENIKILLKNRKKV